MKKIKRFLAIVLVMATVFVLMAIPASAATGFSGSVSDRGKGQGYSWNAYLTADGETLTARLSIFKNSSGLVPYSLSGKLDLTIVPNSGREITCGASSENSGEESLTVIKTVDISGMDINHVTCVFSPCVEEPVTLHLYASQR